tara:strand:- start:731 stop:1651 length:921 start_codon:yes stop_codon:yes gene_type:complete
MNQANSNSSDIEFAKKVARYALSWLIFIKERFSPISHIPMILLFCSGTATLASVSDFQSISYASVLAFLFFFRLRLFDEIKDYELDKVINPTRPLPRQVLTIFDLKIFIILGLIAEYNIIQNLLPDALRAWVIAALWSLFMYKEFFIPKLIRPYLTTYATTHTLVTFPLTLALIAGMNESAVIQTSDLWASFGAWLVFNIFELGRKTFQANEERGNVESYSKVWGKTGAVALVLAQAFLAAYSFERSYPYFTSTIYLYIPAILLFLASIYFLLSKSKVSGLIYRASSSVFIILIYTILTISPYLGS